MPALQKPKIAWSVVQLQDTNIHLHYAFRVMREHTMKQSLVNASVIKYVSIFIN
jgi:hypothetical protein